MLFLSFVTAFLRITFIRVGVLLHACLYTCMNKAQGRPEEVIGPSETGTVDSCGFWNLSLFLLLEQSVV